MKRLFTLFISAFVIVFAMAGCSDITVQELSQILATEQVSNQVSITSPADDIVTYDVIRVVDGDTIVIDLDGTETKIRMIGVDTPESVHSDNSKNCQFGKISSDYTENLLSNQSVSLEYDAEKYDKYGRVLAYVYLDENMVNLDLVINGYAVAKEYEPNTKYAEVFTEAQIKAEKAKSGMWSDDVSDSDCNLKSEYYINY